MRLLFPLAFLFVFVCPIPAKERPNILLILVDDLGWSDLACYGNHWFETPHLDSLAAEGARFTRAYAAAPICSASRAALLTGKSTARLGFEFVTKPKAGPQPVHAPLRAPNYTLDLALEEVTIAESLSRGGYETAFFGKWHLNQHFQAYLGWSPTHGPKAQGFEVAEEDFGSHPYSYWDKKKERRFLEVPEGEFIEDGLTERAIRFLKGGHDRPFFLMVSHFYVHDPVHTRLEWLHDHYQNKIPEDHPRREVLAHYAAMVATLDHHVGQLLVALDELGLADSTFVVFTSDNGGHPDYAGNAPLRGSKWNLYEGGIRVPTIIRWPEAVEPGTVIDTPVWSPDLFPTFAALAGADPPLPTDGRNLVPLLKNPALDAEAKWEPARMVWHFPYYHPEATYDRAPDGIGVDDGVTSKTRPHSAIREDDWKLLHFYQDDRYELYDLASSDDESEEILRLYEARGTEARERLAEYLESVGARLPVANPDFIPEVKP